MINQSFPRKGFNQKLLGSCEPGAVAFPDTDIKKMTTSKEKSDNMPKKVLQRIPYEKFIVIAGLLN